MMVDHGSSSAAIGGTGTFHGSSSSANDRSRDQTTLGHQYIKQQFNVTPRIGWQIDPFRHYAVQAYLLGAEVLDFTLFILGELTTKTEQRGKVRRVLRASKSLGTSSQIFAGAFPENYEPPSGFYFEVNDDSPVVQDFR
nr:probable alpha-mannosidase At5g13980 isoform X3 [Ipomoea trifida]